MKITKTLGIGFLMGALAVPAFAATPKVIDIQNVRMMIAKKHAHWKAKQTWVSRLTKKQIQRMLGLKVPPKGNLNYEGVHSEDSSLPATLDWRNVKGVDWLGPIMNQGNCGSCVAFATVATLEARTSIAWGSPWLRPSFSPQAIFDCGGGGCDTGWMPDDAAQYLENYGAPDEACMPYTSGSTGNDESCSMECSDAASRSLKIASYTMPTSYGGSIDAVKEALKNGPLETTLSVYADFMTYSSGVYKHVTGSYLGGHAVSLVGYSNAKRAWLIRNSWGTEWGENGFAWVSWDDTSGVGADTWAFDVPTSPNFLDVARPADRGYISGNYQLVAKGPGVAADSDVTFHIKDANGHEVATLACGEKTGQNCIANLNTKKLKQGYYTIYAGSASASTKSQIRQFYILNSVPIMHISFKPASGVDLSTAVSGRPEFLIDAESSPVPIQHIEFRAIDSHGKIVSIKSNDYVLTHMKMGWRTISVPDGQYTILFHGETKYNGKVYAVDSNSYSISVRN